MLPPTFLKDCPYKPNLFAGKVVFVTGGAGTICKDQTEALVRLGANAAIVGRKKEVTEQAARDLEALRPGSRVLGLGETDVRDIRSLKRAVDKTLAELGRIDYVIAGAAGNFVTDVNHMSANAFKTVIDIDLLGSFNTAKATFEALRESKGSLVFVSATAHYHGSPFTAHVGSAKAGIDALMQALAVELGPLGIRINCIAPGFISGTEGMDRLLPPDMQKTYTRLTPLQRFGSTLDIANATVWLFSDAASYVSGTVIVVDGGGWHSAQQTSTIHFYPDMLKQMGEDKSKI
ncbi:Peroxisomal 2,4-dienoyl-CoA reductase SPS19 [Yarrowia sp. B02]|nr:Peroxisomal 2,4-dienoyl-CoA reductase SPS19 [Yarrowia sp. B02]